MSFKAVNPGTMKSVSIRGQKLAVAFGFEKCIREFSIGGNQSLSLLDETEIA